MWRHYQYMAWSYLGLLAASCNEAFMRVAPLRHVTARIRGPLALLNMVAVVALSGAVIFGLQRRVLQRYSQSAEAAVAGGRPRE
jgi:hypothetical protein